MEERRNIPMQLAAKEGAMMLFGEKYGDTVRSIRFGKSHELCGGTHVKSTGELWFFKIISESAIAAGIRRIEAITSDFAKEYFVSQDEELKHIKGALKNPVNILQSVQNLQDETHSLKKELERLLHDKAQWLKKELLGQVSTINGIQFLSTAIDMDAATIKNLAFELGDAIEDLFYINGSVDEDKALLTLYISKNIVKNKQLRAGTIVKELGKFIEGGGGGQDFFATAGGKRPEGIKDALKAAKELIMR
ncbi:MAG: DHHA1 domain-containing protein [Flavobacteriaceae bacterium]|nr:DHHA1 domain-containing protein [Flavobacteriaceae bacterium]